MHVSDTADWIQFIGRILFSLLFLSAGFNHLRNAKALGEYAKYKKVPLPVASTVATGFLLIAGALGIILGVWIDLSFLLLVLFLVPTSFLMHNYWTLEDATARQGDQINFNKNLTLAVAAIVFFAIYASVGTQFGFQLTDPLFNI
ncbi:MAG: hypothetical protein JWN72_2038 [Thermoleophilia bacterium]|nr:hypothetical protein [Thermoleophilia bacterium]